VLVVDDNVDAANSLTQLLKLAGHEAEAVYGATETLARLESFEADVVLLDIGLPEMNGYEVAKRIRALDKDEVIVAVTGYGQAADVKLAREAGFDAHLTKPVAFDDLQRVLRETVQSRSTGTRAGIQRGLRVRAVL
jgi:CheY-like chemotaxis protein